MWIGWFLRILLIAFLVRAVWRFLAGVVDGASGPRKTLPKSVPLVRDPVCGTYVTRSGAVMLKQGGHVEYFCSDTCRQRFSSR